MNKPYVFVTNPANEQYAIKLTEGPFAGIIYQYGAVRLDPDEKQDQLVVKYELTILEDLDHKYNVDELHGVVEEILDELIHEQLTNNNIVYTGGTD